MIKALLLTLTLLIATPANAEILAKDKQLHLAAGAISYSGARLLGFSKGESLALGLLAGFAKEAWDRKHPPHVSSMNDIAATAAGAGLVFMIDRKF